MEQHGNGLLRGSLELPVRLTNVSRLDGGAPLLWRVEQTSLPLALLIGAAGVGATTVLLVVFSFLDLERLLREGLDNLKGQEAENIHNVVIGLGLGDDPEARPLAKPLALAVGEGGLATLRPEDVLLLGHVLGALIGRGEALKGRIVLLLLLLVLLVVALGHLDREEAVDVPSKAHLGPLVLGLRGDVRGARNDTSRIVGGGEVGRIGTSLVVGVLDVLADVLPGQERSKTRDLGLVVADEEDQIIRRDGARATPTRQLRATTEL